MRRISLLLIPLAVIVVGMAIVGPEELAEYQDQGILDNINVQEVETDTEDYRYALSSNEKLYILSKCLNSQTLPESEQNAMTREENRNLDYQELAGSYALVVNRKDSKGQEVQESQGISLCDQALGELQELGIFPSSVKRLGERDYTAVMYSAIDVSAPRNNVLVWKISMTTGKQTANRSNRLLDAYVDADTGKMYEFYVRTNITRWEDVDADAIIRTWAEYMGLEKPQEYEGTNPLSESTSYFKKYTFTGIEGGSTIVTVGFYEGINELFLKISR